MITNEISGGILQDCQDEAITAIQSQINSNPLDPRVCIWWFVENSRQILQFKSYLSELDGRKLGVLSKKK
jgi:hypothetical protein